MAEEKKHNVQSYTLPDDTDGGMVGDDIAIFMNAPTTGEHIVLSVPYGYDVKTLHNQVYAYYRVLLKDNYSAEEKFMLHLNKWEEETMMHSSLDMILDNEEFKAIVKMGKSAVPFIKREMQKGASLLCFALEQIYGKSLLKPTVEQGMGFFDIEKNTELWLKELS